jgi:uncharacterized protein
MNRLNCGFEVKFADGAAEGSFAGYGAVFGNVDSYGDVIAKGAFKATLREAKAGGLWPAMLMQHGGWGVSADDMTPIGVWTVLEEDEVGLKVEGVLATGTQRGREAYELLKMQPRPALNGLSIGYRAKEFTLGTKPEEPRRTLKKVDLVEVSLVTFPANGKARLTSVKQQLAEVPAERIIERALRDAGYSKAESGELLSAVKAKADRGDPGADDAGTAALARLLSTIRS